MVTNEAVWVPKWSHQIELGLCFGPRGSHATRFLGTDTVSLGSWRHVDPRTVIGIRVIRTPYVELKPGVEASDGDCREAWSTRNLARRLRTHRMLLLELWR